jgi:hypothetical protein
MNVPSTGEEYEYLIEFLRRAQESCARLSHLVRDEDKQRAIGWLQISELLRRVQGRVTDLARGRMQ